MMIYRPADSWNVPEYGAIKSSPTKRETRKGEDRV